MALFLSMAALSYAVPVIPGCCAKSEREEREREGREREKGRGAGCYFFYVQCIVLRMLFFGVQYTVMSGPTWPISMLGGEFLSKKREGEG